MRTACRAFIGAAVALGLLAAAFPAHAGVPPFQPEVIVKSKATGKWVGDNVYSPSDAENSGQYAGVWADQGDKIEFKLRAGNDGPGQNRVYVSGGVGNSNFAIKYKRDNQNITDAVTGDTYRTAKLASGKFETITVEVKASNDAPNGASILFGVDVTAAGFPVDGDGALFLVNILT